jgi:hypothetical protein
MSTGQFTINASWGEIKVTNTTAEFTIMIKTAQGEVKLADGAAIPAWGRNAVLIGLREGFLTFDGTSLSPMKALTRLEAAVMMVKAAGLDAQAKALAGASLDFKDADKIPAELRGYIAIAVEHGFVTGYEDGTFRPVQVLTRAEWAALLDRLDRENGTPVTSDGRQIKATVTAIANNAITVTTPTYPGGITYRLDTNAVIYKGGQEISFTDIHVDDQVIINLDSDRQIALLTVLNPNRQVSGKVGTWVLPTASAAGSITLSGNDATRTFTVNSQTKVMLDGRSATLADVRTGDQVSLKLIGNVVTDIALKAAADTVVGTLQAISLGSNTVLPSVTVRSANNVQATYRIADSATVKATNGTAVTLGDLSVGDQVMLKVERDLVTGIQVQTDAAVQVVNGQVQAVVGATTNVAGAITIREGSTSATYIVTSSTEVVLGGQAATFADVRVGDRVSLKLDGSRVTQIAIKTEAVTVNGTLEAVTAGTGTGLATVKIKGANNVSTTYTIAADATIKAVNGTSTEVLLDGKKVTFADIRVGDQVTLTLDGARVTQIAITVEQFTVTGTLQIAAMGGGSIPAAVMIKVNGVTTSYTLATNVSIKGANGATIKLDALNAGDTLTLSVERNLVTAIRVQ